MHTESNELLGQLVAKGDGLAVTGGTLDPKDYEPGENTRLTEDETAIEATTLGIMTVTENKINVTPPVRISDNDMTVTFDISARTASGREVTFEMVQDSLKAAGVKLGIDEEKIKDALSFSNLQRTSVPDKEVAFGKPAVQGQSGGCLFHFQIINMDPSELEEKERKRKARANRLTLDIVQRWEVLCEALKPAAPAAGTTVFGKPVDPPESIDLKVKAVRVGNDVVLSEDKTAYLCSAPVCGYADFDKGLLSVICPITISDDSLEAFLTVHPIGSNELALECKDVKNIVESLAITAQVDWPAVETAIEAAKKTKQIQSRVLVAKGIAPINGDDARLKHHFETEKTVGTERHADGIDFRERDFVVECEVGDLVCRRFPNTEGTPGEDLFGKEIPCEPGKEVELEPGPNVRVSEDDNDFYATISGVVMDIGNVIDVSDVVTVEGDVDFNSGNIRTVDSSVLIKGAVRSDFAVEAAGHVIVEKLVEDAILKSGGNIIVRRGILHSGKGFLHALGSVEAQFAQNAAIEAGEDIVLGTALNANLSAGGSVVIKEGKGRLIGGVTRAHKGVEINELGADSEVVTLLYLGTNSPEIEKLNRRIETTQEKLKQLNITLGRNSFVGPSPLKGKKLHDKNIMLVERAEAEEKLDQYEERREALVSLARTKNYGRVIVHRTAHPGVIVKIFEKSFTVTKAMKRCVFFYEPEYDRVATAPLS